MEHPTLEVSTIAQFSTIAASTGFHASVGTRVGAGVGDATADNSAVIAFIADVSVLDVHNCPKYSGPI